MFKLKFDGEDRGSFESIEAARKELKKLSSFRVQKFINNSWSEDSDIVSGFERSGPERDFSIIRVGGKFDK